MSVATRTIWIVIVSALAGVLISLLGIYLFARWYERGADSPDQSRRKYIVDFSKREQLTYGKNCVQLNTGLRNLLEKEISPLLQKRKPGENWDRYTSSALKQELDDYREYMSMCRRLYLEGRNGEINGLQNLAFTTKIDKDLATLGILMKYGAPRQNCDSRCIDERFKEVEDRYNRILTELKKSP